MGSCTAHALTGAFEVLERKDNASFFSPLLKNNFYLAVFIPVGKGYMKNARSLQMWGAAHVLTIQDNPGEFKKGAAIMRIDEIGELFTGAVLPDAVKEPLTIVRIVPEMISGFNSTEEPPVKYVWHTDESALK